MAPNAKARDEIAEQATQWLVRLDAGTADPDAFEQWRDSDPYHASIFAQVVAIWQKAGDLRWAPPLPSPPPQEQQEPPPAGRRARMGPFSRRAAIGTLAASIAGIAAGGGYLLHARRHFAETGIGERRIVQLPGGSHAELNTDTRVAWRMDEVLGLWLERGEAAITVAREAASGLVLHARTLRAVLDEGSYNLRLHGDGPRLTVMAGKALVDGENGLTATLTANQLLAGSAAGFRTIELSDEELQRAEAWRRGEIVFDGMRLSEALTEFNRYLPRPIMVADPSLSAIRLGGRFRTDDPQGFLQSMHDAFGIGSRIEGGHILLYGNENIS